MKLAPFNGNVRSSSTASWPPPVTVSILPKRCASNIQTASCKPKLFAILKLHALRARFGWDKPNHPRKQPRGFSWFLYCSCSLIFFWDCEQKSNKGEKNKLSEGAKLEIKGEIWKEAPYVVWSNAFIRRSPHQRLQRIALKANRGGRLRHPIGGRWVDGIGSGRRDPRLDWVAIPQWTSTFSRLGRFGSAGSRHRRLVIAPSSAMIVKPIYPSDSWFVNPSPLLLLSHTYMWTIVFIYDYAGEGLTSIGNYVLS